MSKVFMTLFLVTGVLLVLGWLTRLDDSATIVRGTKFMETINSKLEDAVNNLPGDRSTKHAAKISFPNSQQFQDKFACLINRSHDVHNAPFCSPHENHRTL